MKYHSVAVIGRIPFDDEDSCLVFNDVTPDEAARKFSDEMYEPLPDGSREERLEEAGELGVYINHVLTSDTDINYR